MHDENGQRDLLQIFSEVGLREGNDAVVMRLCASHHALPPPVPDHSRSGLGARTVESEEGAGGYLVVEPRAVRGDPRLKAVENLLRQSARIGGRLHHERRHRRDDGRLRRAALPVTGEVVHHLAAAGRMSDMHRSLDIEVSHQRGEVVGVVVHIVPIGRLARAAVAAPVVGNDAKALIQEEEHLRIPVVPAQRPAVAENDGLTLAPVFEEDLRAVLRGDEAHGELLTGE